MQESKNVNFTRGFHKLSSMDRKQRYRVVSARQISNTARFTAAGIPSLAVAEEDIDSVERIAGKHAAVVAVVLEPRNIEAAASVDWKRLGPIVESNSWEVQILHAQVVSSWGELCPRIDAE